jgi:hypothetical protein
MEARIQNFMPRSLCKDAIEEAALVYLRWDDVAKRSGNVLIFDIFWNVMEPRTAVEEF